MAPVEAPLWADEFNGAAGAGVDPTKWKYQTGKFYNNELETYIGGTANAAHDGKGHLAITARKTSSGYTSARLNSRYVFTHGYLEGRILLPRLRPLKWCKGDLEQVGISGLARRVGSVSAATALTLRGA